MSDEDEVRCRELVGRDAFQGDRAPLVLTHMRNGIGAFEGDTDDRVYVYGRRMGRILVPWPGQDRLVPREIDIESPSCQLCMRFSMPLTDTNFNSGRLIRDSLTCLLIFVQGRLFRSGFPNG